MDGAALAGLCWLLARGQMAPGPGGGPGCARPPATPIGALAEPPVSGRTLSGAGDRDAIARVALAEAGDQSDSGLAAVVYTILNRLRDGRWGRSVSAVLNAPGQFEPVMRAAGSWRRLPEPTAAQRVRVDTILNLVLEGRLPDLTQGARYFQNPQIVAARAARGLVARGLVDFGGASPSATIGAHRFYVELRARPARRAGHPGRSTGLGWIRAGGAIFAGENLAGHGADETRAAPGAGRASLADVAAPPTTAPAAGPPGDGADR